jgi:hypothetical protein
MRQVTVLHDGKSSNPPYLAQHRFQTFGGDRFVAINPDDETDWSNGGETKQESSSRMTSVMPAPSHIAP